MKRLWQVFVAPGDESIKLKIDPSPWHIDRLVRIPREHWNIILKFISSIDKNMAKILSAYSKSQIYEANEEPFSSDELSKVISFLENVIDKIEQTDSLVPEPTKEIPENYTNYEHTRMVKAVIEVFREAIRLHEPFQAWIE